MQVISKAASELTFKAKNWGLHKFSTSAAKKD